MTLPVPTPPGLGIGDRADQPPSLVPLPSPPPPHNAFTSHLQVMEGLTLLQCVGIASSPPPPPHNAFTSHLQVMEGLTLLQCVGIASCPYIFLLTSTTKIRRFLHTLSVAAVNSVTGKTRRSKVSPAQFDFSDG